MLVVKLSHRFIKVIENTNSPMNIIIAYLGISSVA